jgi:hypothetical protein
MHKAARTSLAGYWPNASEEEQPVPEPLNSKPKYVASTTLTEPLEWQNATLLQPADHSGRRACEGVHFLAGRSSQRRPRATTRRRR